MYLSLSVGWVACQLLGWPVLLALGWGSLGVGSVSGSDTWMKLFLLDSVLLGRLVLRLLGYSSAAIFDLLVHHLRALCPVDPRLVRISRGENKR